MRRNPALAAIILCVASLRLAAQTSEGTSAGGGQSEPSPQQNALGQDTARPSTCYQRDCHAEPFAALCRKSSNRPVIPRSVATRNLLLREEHKKQIPRSALHHTVRGPAR